MFSRYEGLAELRWSASVTLLAGLVIQRKLWVTCPLPEPMGQAHDRGHDPETSIIG